MTHDAGKTAAPLATQDAPAGSRDKSAAALERQGNPRPLRLQVNTAYVGNLLG